MSDFLKNIAVLAPSNPIQAMWLLHKHLVELRSARGVAALSSNQEYLAAMRYYSTFITTANAQNAFRPGALPPLLSDQVAPPQAPVSVARPPMAIATAQPSNQPSNLPMSTSAVAPTPAGSTSSMPTAATGSVYKVQPPTMVGRQPALPAVHQLLAQPIFAVRASDYPAESPLNPLTPFAAHKYKCMTRRQHTQLLVQLMIFGNFVRGHSVPTSLMDGFRYFFNRGVIGQPNSPQAQALLSVVPELHKLIPDPMIYLTSLFAHLFKAAPLNDQWVATQHNSLESARRMMLASRSSTDFESTIAARWQSLSELQHKMRAAVVATIPSADLARGTRIRSIKQVQADQRKRERASAKVQLEQDRAQKRQRRAFADELEKTRQEWRRHFWGRDVILAQLAKACAKAVADKSKQDEIAERERQRARIEALKRGNKSEYMQLVAQTKNERIRELLRQSDNFMRQLGASIRQEQHGAPASEAAPAASVDDEEPLDVSGQSYYQLVHSVSEPVTQQPSLLAPIGQMREYQLAGLQWMVSLYNNSLSGILADEMGLGKTLQTVSLVAYLMEHKHNQGPFLVISPMALLRNNWAWEFERWLPTARTVVYDGDRDERKRLRALHLNGTPSFNVLLTTYEFAMRDRRYLRKLQWEYIIVDEAHRLKNPKCKLVQDLNSDYVAKRRLALTGTPLQNDLPELWALLNFLHPTVFNSVDTFEKWFAAPFSNLGSKALETDLEVNEEMKFLIIERLHSILRPFLLRRIKSDVESQLPEKIERVLRCPMSAQQRLLYNKLSSKSLGLHNQMVQFRKVCNHPLLFHPVHLTATSRSSSTLESTYEEDYDTLVRSCGKMELLDRMLPKLKAAGHRVLVFCQMTKMMDILEGYCRLRGFTFLRLDGSTSQEGRTRSLQLYNAPDSPYFLFMLSTRAGGLGLNLQTANTVIIFDSDWNPQNDNQAQARAHRIGQKQQVIVLRLITSDSVEEQILEIAHNKLDAEAKIIQGGMFTHQYSEQEHHAQLSEMVKTREDNDDPDDGDEGESVDIVSQAMARSDDELQMYLKMEAERQALLGSTPPLLTANEIPAWTWDFVAVDRSAAAQAANRKADPWGNGIVSGSNFDRVGAAAELDRQMRGDDYIDEQTAADFGLDLNQLQAQPAPPPPVPVAAVQSGGLKLTIKLGAKVISG